MRRLIKINSKNLRRLDNEVEIPLYDRSALINGIVHVGVGGFHRSHEAYYIDELLKNHGVRDWAICGVGLMEADKIIQKALQGQDLLYTLMTLHPEGRIESRVIGSITEYLYAPDDPVAVIEKMANPLTRIVSLTITEGGYNYNQASGEFDFENPVILWDLKNTGNPKTIFGFLYESLKRRAERGVPAFTILSCDNIQKNGDVAKRMLLAFVSRINIPVARWIETHVNFPNSMVDRITPATTEENKSILNQKYGISDNCPVVCEPFCQWVIEDNFYAGRPPWELVGTQLVTDVSPYEKMKIGLLNAGHSLLGLLGALHGYSYIHEVVKDPLFLNFLREFMDEEVTPVLDKVEGIDLNEYKNSLIERFANKYIRDHVSRICLQSSAKIPKFLLPTISKQLRIGGPVKRSALIIAGWCRYAECVDESGNHYPLEDDMKDILHEKSLLSRKDPLAFLKIEPVFGDLINSKRFTEAYSDALGCLYRYGVTACIKDMNFH